MSVARVVETPRVTKPYTEEQWQAIDASGERVDRRLRELDVRLTMGGEPTFVSIDDRDGPNGTRRRSAKANAGRPAHCCKRLQERFARGGAAALRPGEVVSRRVAAALGVRLLLAARRRAAVGRPSRCWPTSTRTTRIGPEDARLFITTLAERLGVDPETLHPGLRRCLVLPVAGTPAAGERRSAQEPARGR